jgi:eukaryotic-like serine/threonine-protein kinase
MTASDGEPGCDRVDLDVLLFGDEASDEFRISQRHVETCSECQDRLAKTAADDGDWAEVRSAFQPSDEKPSEEWSGRTADLPRLSSKFGAATWGRGHVKLDFLAPPAHPELLGQLGRYQIEQVIGAGGMGIVLKGFDTNLNRPVALKVLAPHLAHSGAARQRFAREARAAAAVVHEHVVAIYNVESEEQTPFLVMQFVSGRSLQDRVELEGPLAAEEILRIGMQAAAGLAAAHAQGVIHRDVKPANIMLENGVERALLTDFGLARAADDASLTHSGIVAGTPHYMSPEQARGETADGRSDLFSLGSVLYFMATGHPPFRAEQAMAVLNRICHDRPRPVWDINRQIPHDLADVIHRLLEKKPGRRFASADEVQKTLADVLKGLQSPRAWRPRRLVRGLARRPVVLRASCAVVALAGLIWSSTFFFHAIEQSAPNAGPPAASPQSTNVIRNKHLLSEETLALLLGTPPAAFAKELSVIEKELQAIEESPYPEAASTATGRGRWTRETNAARQEIERMEESFPEAPGDLPRPGSPDGHKK